MTPPCYTFSAAELPVQIQLDVQGRQRKLAAASGPASAASSSSSSPSPAELRTGDGGQPSSHHRPRHHGLDLRDCALLTSMVQYSCTVTRPERHDSPVRCWPVQRLFRQCRDRSGPFMVETTAWEAGATGSSQDSGGGGITGADRAVASAGNTEATAPGETARQESRRVF